MHASQVIETYVDDTVRLLPRRKRNDVASELRSLLGEELHARAQQSGSAPDESVALSLVRDYGHPNEVAARYQPPWAVIDPADTTSFVRAAIIGASALILLAAMSLRLNSPDSSPKNLVGIGVPFWLGVLVVIFGAKNWFAQRRPAAAQWQPRDRDRSNRIGSIIVIPFATFCTILYAAPTWVMGLITGGRWDPSWAAYTAEFQWQRIPIFVGLLSAMIALLAFAAIRGRWSRLTRRIDIGINLALACLLLIFSVDGNMFQSSEQDRIARDIFALVGVIYLPTVCVMLYGEIGRLDRRARGREE